MLNRTEGNHRRAVDRWLGQFLVSHRSCFRWGESQWHAPRSSDFPERVLAVFLPLWFESFDRVDGVDAREEGIFSGITDSKCIVTQRFDSVGFRLPP
jgi:hypothetical protein